MWLTSFCMQIHEREVCLTAGLEAKAELMTPKSVLNHLRTYYGPDTVTWEHYAKVSVIHVTGMFFFLHINIVLSERTPTSMNTTCL